MPTLERHYGAYVVRSRSGSELVQTDWDYPKLAERFGWTLLRVQRDRHGVVALTRRPRRPACFHRGTDGTVDCPDCGITATEFIRAAGSFLSLKAE